MLQPVGDFWAKPLQAPYVALHGQVAAAVAVLLDQVLPDPLSTQPTLQGLRDHIVIGRRQRRRPGDRVWPGFATPPAAAPARSHHRRSPDPHAADWRTSTPSPGERPARARSDGGSSPAGEAP